MDERFLIIETAHRQGVVAVALGDRVVGARHLEEARRHARDLVPRAQDLLRAQGWRARDLTAVVVSRGPGSYTGLRVGLMSAKTLAYATGSKLLGVDTFAAIALQVPLEASSVDVLADAQQDKIYVQRYIKGHGGTLEIQPYAAWLASLPAGSWVTGPGLEKHAAAIPDDIGQAPRKDWWPRPESLLALALARWRGGEHDDPFTLDALYLRASSAEEKWRK
ncbi:MAG TPA: tRNA (adenosine(37)-N6)-threonylcarbamoyltransferase complex dimerization subunit type 1 TsaB [Gemmataceae bacterium]|nr:tRNA (adenosine(37)-N6)-threonylcarbamoyltransferase complex dimerization subunit type 1 TsaB [Gemmataceae bacterium]